MTRIIILVSVLVFVGAVGAGAYYYGSKSQSPEAQAKLEAEAVIAVVARHMQLPEDETPTVAEITDPSKLEGQPFFKSAKAGFQILIYTKAGKVILYDPISDRIIEAAPLLVDISSQQWQ